MPSSALALTLAAAVLAAWQALGVVLVGVATIAAAFASFAAYALVLREPVGMARIGGATLVVLGVVLVAGT